MAVDVPGEVVGAVDAAAGSAREAVPDLAWTDPGGWHLTLAFLGSVEDERVPGLAVRLDAVGATVARAEVALAAEAERAPGGRVLWVPLEDDAPLRPLTDAVRGAVRLAGLACDDRPFTGHLTLARARDRGRVPRAAADAYGGVRHAWTVSEVVLYRSHLGQGPGRRARYEALSRVPLRDDAGT